MIATYSNNMTMDLMRSGRSRGSSSSSSHKESNIEVGGICSPCESVQSHKPVRLATATKTTLATKVRPPNMSRCETTNESLPDDRRRRKRRKKFKIGHCLISCVENETTNRLEEEEAQSSNIVEDKELEERTLLVANNKARHCYLERKGQLSTISHSNMLLLPIVKWSSPFCYKKNLKLSNFLLISSALILFTSFFNQSSANLNENFNINNNEPNNDNYMSPRSRYIVNALHEFVSPYESSGSGFERASSDFSYSAEQLKLAKQQLLQQQHQELERELQEQQVLGRRTKRSTNSDHLLLSTTTNNQFMDERESSMRQMQLQRVHQQPQQARQQQALQTMPTRSVTGK